MALPESIVIRSFAGGELSPTLAARADLAKYQIGLRRCRNFLVQRHGGVANRAGTRFCGPCKTDAAEVKIFRYVSEVPTESILIEVGVSYLRFWQQGVLIDLDPVSVPAYSGATAYIPGDLVVSGGIVYYAKVATTGNAPPDPTFWHPQVGNVLEVPTPFSDPANTNLVQSGRVITLTHPSVNPHDLVFQAVTRWPIFPVVTEPSVPPPTSVVLAAPGGALRYAYKITAAAPGTYEESEASAVVFDAAVAAPTQGAPHQLSWTPVLVGGVAAPEYYVYCDPFDNGTFGFIGTATGAARFNNAGFVPDFRLTPPIARNLFAGGSFPAVCAYHGQRRFFANTPAEPDAVSASRVGFPDNFGISSPLQDDDAITFRIAGNNDHAVRVIVPVKDPLIMTDGGEWRLTGEGGLISPNTLRVEQETYVGVHDRVMPVVVGNTVIYVQARGSIVRDLRFNQDVESVDGKDLTIFASHLFDGRTIVSMDYAQVPDSIVWAVRSDGVLLGLTYIREQDIFGWHRHDTAESDGFEHVCVVPEPGEDAVYVIARRVVGGVTKRYIERLESRAIFDFDADSFFVDAGLSYTGPPVSAIGGLDHLEGRTVRYVADGEDRGTVVVNVGNINIGTPAVNVHVGLPIEAEIDTLDLDVAGAAVRDQQKRPHALNVIVDASSRAFLAGPDSATLERVRIPPYEPAAVDQFTGQVEVALKTRFDRPGRVFIRQDKALPLTILGVIPNVELGG